MKAKYLKNLLSADPTTPIVLFQMEMQNQGKYFFHAGENGYRNPLVFGNAPYDYYPILGDGFDVQGDGRLPRPKITLSNHQGNVSLRLKYFDDFTSARVTRIKTMLKYLDNLNFPNSINPHGEPDPESFTKDVYFVNQKVRETDDVVEFELVSALEIENAKIPCRSVYSNTCSWNYRSKEGCGYSGKPIADKKGNKFINAGYEGPYVGSQKYFGDITDEALFAEPLPSDKYEEWDSTKTYNAKDVVEITTLSGDQVLTPPSVYVCIKDGTQSYPVKDREAWVEDACDKSICGCKLRFSEDAAAGGGCKRMEHPPNEKYSEMDEGLPFGGFPGVDPYEFK